MSATASNYQSFIESAASEWVSGITELSQQLATAYTTEAQRWTALANFYTNKFESLGQQAQVYGHEPGQALDIA